MVFDLIRGRAQPSSTAAGGMTSAASPSSDSSRSRDVGLEGFHLAVPLHTDTTDDDTKGFPRCGSAC